MKTENEGFSVACLRCLQNLKFGDFTSSLCRGPGRLSFARKIRLEWNAGNGTGFSRCGVSPGPSLSRLEENNSKSKWRLHLQCRKAGKVAEVNRVEWEFTMVKGFFRSFRLERENRNASEDFHLFWKLSGGMSCTIGISNRKFRFLLTNGKRFR